LSYWVYEYDVLGQVKSGKRYWYGGTPVAGQQFEYEFDDIGNRTSTKAGGDANGANLRSASYTANALNQYTDRTVPGYVDIIGAALATNSVTVNGQAAYRKGEYFRKELSVDNSSEAVWTNITVVSGGTSVSGHRFVAQTPESFSYDLDGNLTSDGRWSYTWNAENRRSLIESGTGVLPVARMREQWTYLPDGRWIERIVSTNNGSAYYAAYTNRYVWDGQVLLAVLDHTNGLVMSFMRGLDLSGTIHGAGGVGGLLAVSFKTDGTHFAAYDGNGNVAALVSAADGSESARYEYGPFAEPIRITGPVAKANPIRFSTQYADDVTGDLKYPYGDYRPDLGRRLSRDPIGEQSGRNLHSFAQNDSINSMDHLGLHPTRPNPRPSTHAMYVPKCTIVVLYGHGHQTDHWTWKMSTQGCNGCAAVMCWPVSNGTGCSPNLWEPEVDFLGTWSWDPSIVDEDDKIPMGRLDAGKYNLRKVIGDVYIRAVRLAIQYCKDPSCKCKCKSIDIKAVRVTKSGEVIEEPDPKQKTGSATEPNMPSFSVPCR